MNEYNQIEFENLIADLNSNDLENRIKTSEKICWFVENKSENLDYHQLKNNINKLIDVLKIETNPDVGYKLGESIFEFIWLDKLSKKEVEEIIIKLVNLNTFWIFPSYLENDDYINFSGVKEYLKKYKKS